MLAGVTIERPETVTIDMHVRVGTDTMIGTVRAAAGLTPRSAKIAASARARFSKSSMLADRVMVAPYTDASRIRASKPARRSVRSRACAWSAVGADARVGNFVELKKTQLGAGVKSQHLAYLGDAEIGDALQHRRGNHHLQL